MKTAARMQAKPETGRASGPSSPFFRAPVQTKLRVGRPGDKHEREADAAADAVVHGRGPMSRGGAISPRMTPLAQRAPEDGAQMMEEEAQTSCERRSDPNYDAFEPTTRYEPPVVEDEPLSMMAEDQAQAMEEAQTEEEEAAQTQEEEAQTQEEEEEAQTQEEEETAQTEMEAQRQEEEEAQTQEEEAAQTQEEEEAAQTQEEEAQTQEEEEEAQMRPMPGPRPSAAAIRRQTVERQLQAARGRGNPLPEAVRAKMEKGLGADFTGVRVHTDAPAFLMTKLLRAKAFASGRDIFFSPNRFAPRTKDGDHLLAHELAHTLQQGAVDIHDEATAQRVEDDDRQFVRPESLKAIQIARGEIGKINSTLHGTDGNRIGWERLQEIFRGAFGGDVIAPALVKRIIKSPDQLPHWCGIFAWWALKKAGLPLPHWKPGAPMLKNTEPREAGTLPQKGDIAYRIYAQGKAKTAGNMVHHQALVSGVESAATAAGKPFKSILVRTVDGNTAGSDNLGGQVEEKWQPIAAWDFFFDPTAKLSLPDVPLVETDRASDDAGPAAADEKAAGPEEPPADEAPSPESTGASDIDEPPVVEPEGLPGPEDEVAVDMPPFIDAEAEPAAEVEKVSLEGASDQAMVGFVDASPSAMAATSPDLGDALDKKTSNEKKSLAEDAPVLTAETGGEVDPGVTAPEDLPVPADTTLADNGMGPEVGELAADPYEERGTAPSTRATRDQIDRQPEGGFLDWLKNSFFNVLNGMKTKDDSVNTSAGPRQRVAMTGDADPGRMTRQREGKTQELRDNRDDHVGKFKQHPGQSNIQPRKIEEARPTAVSPETSEPVQALPPDDGAKAYVEAELPKDVRDAADAKIAPGLHGNLADARAQTVAAATKRDADKAAAISKAEADVAKANKEADDGQRKAVLAGRTDAARQQGEAITGAYDGVAEFAGDSGKRETDDRKIIADDVKTEEDKADGELEKGETKAKDTKRDQEAKAAEKKEELKREEKKGEGGLWGWIKSKVKKFVKAITEAIDFIFTELRRMVKEAIEAAKNAAIKLINAARKAAIGALNKFRDWAKDKVNTYLGDRFPGLANALNKGIDATVDVAIDGVNAAADGAIAAVEAAAGWLSKALDKALSVFQTGLKAAVGIAGAIITGDFAEAARIAVEAACDIAGVDSKPVFDFFDRAGKQIMSILKSPGKFINNVMRAVRMGVDGFIERFGTHLKTGLIKWLTGAMSVVPIELPTKWDVMGFFKLVAQILGLTYENIKARIIKKFPKAQTVFTAVEAAFTLIPKLLKLDFAGLWEEVKAKLSDLKQTIFAGIRNWAIVEVIKQGLVTLISLLNPASALVRAIKLIADLIFWLIDNFQRIKEFVLSVYGAVSNLAAGVVEPAAKKIEEVMANALPVVISFAASIAGFGRVGEAVRDVIEAITKPINKMIDKLIDKVVAFAKKLFGKAKAGAKAVGAKAKEIKDKVLNWWKAKSGFADEQGHSHTLSYKGSKSSAKLQVASSNPLLIEPFLKKRMTEAKAGGATFTVKQVTDAQNHYKNKILPAEKNLAAADKGSSSRKKTKGVNENKKLADALQGHLVKMGKVYLKPLFGPSPKDVPPPQLPVMADNVKARSFKSDYIVKGNGYPYSVNTGTESGKHVGNLDGWSVLQAAGLTVGSKFVRMHLLPHRLAGDAVDSNLTPADGPRYNVPFASSVEGSAIGAAITGGTKNKPIWYDFSIGYHSGAAPAPAFPNLLKAEWGHYERDPSTGNWRRAKTEDKRTENPKIPSFTPVAPDLNDPATTAGDIAAAAGVDGGFGTLILNLRNTLPGSTFGKHQSNFTRKMNDRYVDRASGDTRRGIQDYDARMKKVKAAISSGAIVMR